MTVALLTEAHTNPGDGTLQHRLSGELATSAAVFAHPMLISAWGTFEHGQSDQRT